MLCMKSIDTVSPRMLQSLINIFSSLTIFSSRIESHSVTALVFKVKEMAKFDVSGMRSISVALKDFVDRSAMCSSTNFFSDDR